MVPVNASLPYGSPRSAEWEEIKVRTVHRGRHWRVEEIAVFAWKDLLKITRYFSLGAPAEFSDGHETTAVPF